MRVHHNYYKHFFYLFFFTTVRMSKNNINFDNKKIKKKRLLQQKQKIFNKDDIDVNKILVSKREQYGKYNSFKYFIGYDDNDVNRP